ncbi:MAG: ATP-binding cassette domain-containing protein [Paracoccaceae bacterium]|jgi:tungstate transport system ATP-binding protein
MFPMTVCDLSVKFRQKHIIGPINLTINERGITVLMGPNGAGKTTLLKALHGIIRLANGQVTFATPAKTTQQQQSFVFQSPIMLRRSVLENLAYPLMINGQDKQSAMERGQTWAEKIGLSAHVNRPAPFLSGGEKQKIALARALITSPKLLFLDEPTASLDGAATIEIEALLSEAQSTGTTIIMSTHNIGQARRIANSVLFMKDGQIDAHLTADAFFDRPPTEAAQKFIAGDIVL